MSRFRVLFWLLPRRLRASWGLLAVTSFGTLAAVTFLAIGAIYSRALAEGGLRHSLASVDAAGKVALVLGLTDDLVKLGYDASRMIKAMAELIGGSGGGRKDFAQAGGKHAGRVDAALAKAASIVREARKT